MLNEAFREANLEEKKKKWPHFFPKMAEEKNNTIFTVRGRERNMFEFMVAF